MFFRIGMEIFLSVLSAAPTGMRALYLRNLEALCFGALAQQRAEIDDAIRSPLSDSEFDLPPLSSPYRLTRLTPLLRRSK